MTGANLVRYRPEVERAIYFCCLEALQNTYKHAHTATTAHVRLAARGRELTSRSPTTAPDLTWHGRTRAGFHNMHNRVASLGGSLRIDAARGQGTRITGAIPLTAESGERLQGELTRRPMQDPPADVL